MNVLLISDALHYRNKNGAIHSYAPYVKELELWAKNATKIIIVAPTSRHAQGLQQEVIHENIRWVVVPRITFHKPLWFVFSLFMIPLLWVWLIFYVRSFDHIHLRAPGHLAFLTAIALTVSRSQKKTSIKYAGNWSPGATNQSFSYRFQRLLYKNTWAIRNNSVMAYGSWPDMPPHVKSFFTASFSEYERVLTQKVFQDPIQFIFAGTLTKNKGVVEALLLVHFLVKKGVGVRFDIFGEGPLKSYIENYMSGYSSLKAVVVMHGNKSLDHIKPFYQKAHFSVLLSKSEGWPKFIAESMWYGCIPVVTPVSCVPWMVQATENDPLGQRGLLFKSIEQTGLNILELWKDKDQLELMSGNTQYWSQKYTLERFEEQIKQLMSK